MARSSRGRCTGLYQYPALCRQRGCCKRCWPLHSSGQYAVSQNLFFLSVKAKEMNKKEFSQPIFMIIKIFVLLYCHHNLIKKSQMPLYSADTQKKLNISRGSTIKNISNIIGQLIPVFTQVVRAFKLVLSRGRSSLLYSLSYQHVQLPMAIAQHCS